MLSILGFLIMLGPLVIIHELGHYLFARLFNVKAEAFSVGFGPKIFAKWIGETEWKVSAIPLGGYVKLLGEDSSQELSPEDQKRALNRQVPYKRFFIFAGGPLFNFLFAAVLFSLIVVIGEETPGNIIGRVVKGSYAEQSGFKSGDRVLMIDSKPIKRFEDVRLAIMENPGKQLQFVVQNTKESQSRTLMVSPKAQDGFSVYGEQTHVGEIEGLLAAGRGLRIGVSFSESPAGKAGLKTGDEITQIDGTPVKSWEEFESELANRILGQKKNVQITFNREGAQAQNTTLDLDPGMAASGSTSSGNTSNDAEKQQRSWGLYSSELFVEQVLPGSPADKAGLKANDRIIQVGNSEIYSFFALKDAVQRSGENEGKVFLKWEREGKVQEASVIPNANSVRDPVLRKTQHYTIGVVPQLKTTVLETVIERTLNPFVVVFKGFERMVVFSYRNFVSIGKMFTGEVSVATLGGPIMIGKIAGESLAHGLITFLTTMAMLSIGLGVLNILPVPVLDGGHILMLGIETIRGKPLSMRQMEIIQSVGLGLILLLMFVVIKNDLTRLPFFN